MNDYPFKIEQLTVTPLSVPNSNIFWMDSSQPVLSEEDQALHELAVEVNKAVQQGSRSERFSALPAHTRSEIEAFYLECLGGRVTVEEYQRHVNEVLGITPEMLARQALAREIKEVMHEQAGGSQGPDGEVEGLRQPP